MENLGDYVHNVIQNRFPDSLMGDAIHRMVEIAAKDPWVLRQRDQIPPASRKNYQEYCSARALINLIDRLT